MAKPVKNKSIGGLYPTEWKRVLEFRRKALATWISHEYGFDDLETDDERNFVNEFSCSWKPSGTTQYQIELIDVELAKLTK